MRRSPAWGRATAGELLVDGGFAKTHAVFDGDKVLTDEVASRVQGVAAGPIRIAAWRPGSSSTTSSTANRSSPMP